MEKFKLELILIISNRNRNSKFRLADTNKMIQPHYSDCKFHKCTGIYKSKYQQVLF